MHGGTDTYYSLQSGEECTSEFLSDVVSFCCLKSAATCNVASYPVQLFFGDAPNAAVEVQVLLSGEQAVKCVHLGTVADVYPPLTAFHDVY